MKPYSTNQGANARRWAAAVARPAVALPGDQRFTLIPDLARCAELSRTSGYHLDVAACDEAHCAPEYFTVRENGLKQRWSSKAAGAQTHVWANIPFSACLAWVLKAWAEMEARACELVSMLLPATRTEQGWWQRHVEPFRRRGPHRRGRGPWVSLEDHFLEGRTRFGRPGNRHALSKGLVGPKLGVGSPDFTCVLVVWDARPQTHDRGFLA